MKLYNELAEYYFFIDNKTRNISNDISLIKQLLPRNSRSQILDLGCGTGEHLDLLRKEGFKCTGVDASKDMIFHARQRNGPGVQYKVCDMRDINYIDTYDMIICLFGSFNYMLTDKDVDTVMYNTYKALKPGGLAVFEIWNAYPLHRIEEKKLSHISTTYFKEKKILRERGFHIVEKRPRTIVDVFYEYEIFSPENRKRVEDRHTMRAYYQKEIERIIKYAGFKIIERFSSSMKERFHNYSNKLIIVFEKEY